MGRRTLPSGWAKIKAEVLARDGSRCRKCGLETFLEVHHVYGPDDNDPNHIRTLCYWCHCRAPMGDDYWEWEKNAPGTLELISAKATQEMVEYPPEFLCSGVRRIINILGELNEGWKSERVTIGIRSAKRRGTRSGKPIGRPRAVVDRQTIADRHAAGQSYTEIARELGISRATVYRLGRDGV
jgi:hypothetical protein